MFEAIVYFASPRTVFSGKVHDEDVILRRPVPFRWLARLIARFVHAPLDSSRCGYVILDANGVAVEHVEPILPDPREFTRGKTRIPGA